MRAEDLGIRVTAAIKASGKSRAEIIAETGINKSDLSKIENGHAVNLSRRRLALLAKATGTTVGYLHGDLMVLSPEDREELLRHRNWIDGKLPKIDARGEPNAILIASAVDAPVRSRKRMDMIADRPVVSLDVPSAFKRSDVQHVLRARGESMIGAGIMNEDTLYATAAPEEPPVGNVIACRLGGEIYVKRVASEEGHLLLRSENPEYLTIRVDEEADQFEMIGVVIGRIGTVV
ncbi:MAG TPA: S24 family peptidase [Thermoanaerobaculia bacterium]|jgi:phage repressor protein C with HTH and peptisase S24 domain|nr:S24 family peptidase [Thermoanaerobaculia bacterium]